jgi:predicted DNA-binding transcriptional regulator YafY
MKAGSRPQYYRIRRMVQMVREGTGTGYLPNSSDFIKEFEVSRRTVARDLDFLRDEERAPLAYDDARHGFRMTDETYTLPPVRISRKEAFSFGLARKLLAHYEGTPLHLDMRSVLANPLFFANEAADSSTPRRYVFLGLYKQVALYSQSLSAGEVQYLYRQATLP